jgi:hypothetical protein
MPKEQTWTKKHGNDIVIFKAEGKTLSIEVTDGSYEAHYAMDKTKFLQLMRKIGVLFDNEFRSTFDRIIEEKKFDEFMKLLPKSKTVVFVWTETNWDD